MQEYTITVGGLEHTVLLDEDHAKRLAAQPVRTKEAAAPANKARTTNTK